jgi:hAT family C-terminal dimerisation region
MSTSRLGDESCNDAVKWWATIGTTRFPAMAALSRDTLMCTGSSVPSEPSFSDSGHFVSADRAKLNDATLNDDENSLLEPTAAESQVRY